MIKKKILIIFPILLLISVFLLWTYTIQKAPVEIIDLEVFHIDGYHGRIAFYLNCRNASHKKTVDGLILSVICNSDEQSAFQYRVLEPEGVLPKTDHVFLIDFYKGDLPVEDIATAEVFVSQVNFTDGSTWEDHKIQRSKIAQVDQNIATGIFPVRINEALFYEESDSPSPYAPIPFQIDWSNTLEEESIINVIYKVTARTIDGTVILSADEEDAVYVSEFYGKPDKWIQPLTDNKEVTQNISIQNPLNVFRNNGAVTYEVSVCRAVTSKGVIWENTDENDRIAVTICGKKGYAFSEDSWNPAIRSLVERIDEESQKYEMDLGTPEVFVKDHQYCVLRYPEVDIRVELSEANEVLPDKVGFVLYSKFQYEDPERYVQSVFDKMESLRLCVCTSVLTEIPYEEAVQKISEYSSNDKDYIDFEDMSYDTFESITNNLDADKNLVRCWVFACGKDLYYPPDKLLWVRESPYESQQNLEVQHRQSDAEIVEKAGSAIQETELKEVQGELAEPDNIRNLREYYNSNFVGRTGKVFFVDLTGDAEDEMIILETNNMVNNVSLWGTQELKLSVYQWVNDGIAELYQTVVNKEMCGEITSSSDTNYYLYMGTEKAEILMEHCADSPKQAYIKQVSFETNGNDFAELISISLDQFNEKRQCSILLLDSFTMMTPSWKELEEMQDYQSVLNCKEEIADIIKITETSGQTVLDYSVVYNESNKCIFAVTGAIKNDLSNKNNIIYTHYEGLLSVWACYDDKVQRVENSAFGDEGHWMGSEIYQFGKNQHYFVLTGIGGAHYIAYMQHKFCFEDNNVYNIDNTKELYKDENGRIQMRWTHNVEEINGGYLIDDYGGDRDMGDEIYVEDYVDVFFNDHQYTEYAAKTVDYDILKEYENYDDVLLLIEKNFEEYSYIGGAPAYLLGNMEYYVNNVELDNIRKTANNIFYLNYKVYGRRLGANSVDFFDEYSKECNVWAYAVLEVIDSQLEFKRLVFGKRGETTNSGLAVYYGTDKELVEAGNLGNE